MKSTVDSASQQEIVREIADLMARTAIDEIVTHAAIAALIPAELLPLRYSLSIRARDILNKESGIVFAPVKREGYRRLKGATGVQYVVDNTMKRTRRLVRKGQRHTTNALRYANDMIPAERRSAMQALAAMMLVEHLTLAKSVKTMPEEPPTSRPDGFDWLRAAMQR